jgi:hypothetical protein
MSYYLATATNGFGAFGMTAEEFDANLMHSELVASATDNAAGKRWANRMQVALNQLGYSTPLSADFSQANATALAKFQSDNGLAPIRKGWPDKQTLAAVAAALASNKVTGTSIPVTYVKKDGEYVPSSLFPGADTGVQRGGMGMIGMGIAAVAVVAIIAIVAKKKNRGQSMAGAAHHV